MERWRCGIGEKTYTIGSLASVETNILVVGSLGRIPEKNIYPWGRTAFVAFETNSLVAGQRWWHFR